MRAIFFFAAFALVPWGGALEAAPPEDPEALFRKANALFREANAAAAQDSRRAYDLYRSAALRYERLIEEGGVTNAKVLYNLGNAYFQMGDLGRAILAYRRALEYDPNDPNLRRNLRYARSRRLDRFEDTTESQVLKTLLFWHYDFSTKARLTALAVASALFWGLLSVGLYRRLPWGAPAAAALVALALAGSLVAEATFSSPSFGVVTAPETTARRGDGESYEPAFESPLHAGAEFSLLSKRPGWLQIRLPDGRTAWIPARDAELAPE